MKKCVCDLQQYLPVLIPFMILAGIFLGCILVLIMNSRRNIRILERIINNQMIEMDTMKSLETRNTMLVRNIANERLAENTKILNMMERFLSVFR